MSSKPVFVILSGRSGSGKTTLQEAITAASKTGSFRRMAGDSVYTPPSYTTRPARAGEKPATLGADGVYHGAYHFVSPAEFVKMAKEGKFLETVNPQPGVYYGTAKDDIDLAIKHGKITLLVRDPEGAVGVQEYVQSKSNDAAVIKGFIDTDLASALYRRQSDISGTPEYIAGRLHHIATAESHYKPSMTLPDGRPYVADLIIENPAGTPKSTFVAMGLQGVMAEVVQAKDLHLPLENRVDLQAERNNSKSQVFEL